MIHKFNNLKYTLIRDLLQSSQMRDSTKASMLAFNQEATSVAQISIGMFSPQWASRRKSRKYPNRNAGNYQQALLHDLNHQEN